MGTGPRTAMPRLPALYARAVWQAVPFARRRSPARRQSWSPDPTDVRTTGPLHIEAADLARYRRVCGFTADGTVPATYPQVLAFPLLLDLMTSEAFPFPAVGAVHMSNSIVQDRAVHESESVELSVSLTDVLPHRRGLQATVVTQASVEAEPVWRATSTYLGSRKGVAGGTTTEPRSAGPVEGQPPTGELQGQDVDQRLVTLLDHQPWELPAGLGRRYAAASGDCNPIHLSAVTARPFGFRTPIAHGMWTVARVLSQLEDLLIHSPGRLRCDVAFKRPLPLPSTVLMSAYAADGPRRQPCGGNPKAATNPSSSAPDLGPITFRVEASSPAVRRKARDKAVGGHDGTSTAPAGDIHLAGSLTVG
jgi:acyl dehydratase